jgi:nitrite reductase (NADH) small subunit
MDQPLNWLDIGTLDDIPRQGARVIRRDGGQVPIAVFRTVDDRVFALEDRCPHKGGPLSDGIVHGHRVTCPLHNWVIDLATGGATGPDEGCTGSVPVEVRHGRVVVAVAGWRHER